MAVHADVIIVEYVSRRAVDQCRVGRREVASRGNFGRAIVRRGGGRDLRDEPWRLFARTGNHRSNAVEHADACPEQTAFRDCVRTNVGNEFGKTGGERFHDFSHSPELHPRLRGRSSATGPWSTPIRRSWSDCCCARAREPASDAAPALPKNDTNSRRLIAAAQAQDKGDRNGLDWHWDRGSGCDFWHAVRPPDVRFGSKADICTASAHVRFTPNSDIDCAFRQSALGQKADTQTNLH